MRRGDRTKRRGQEHSARLDWRYCAPRWRGQSAWFRPESAVRAQEFGPKPQRKVTPMAVASHVAFAVFAYYLAVEGWRAMMNATTATGIPSDRDAVLADEAGRKIGDIG